jgi:hypothetical protein
MREAAKPCNDITVNTGIPKRIRNRMGMHEFYATVLVGNAFGMHEGHEEEIRQSRFDLAMPATCDGMSRYGKRERVRRKGAGITAKHVAGKLIEKEDERQ